MSTLYTDIEPGQTIKVGSAEITVERKTGRKTRLKIVADSSVRVVLAEERNPKKRA